MEAARNKMLTEVGPGTPAGNMLRCYWWPIACVDQIGTSPVPVRLLGEDLILFRDGTGQFGLLGRYCAHRGTSLEFGRVEAEGIRCCYHGWLYNRSGRCLDTPAEPAGSLLKDRILQTSYTVRAVSGLVFAYLGPQPAPAFPKYDLLFANNLNRVILGRETHCNWLQRAENIVDPHHIMALHASIYPELGMNRPDVTWTETANGTRMVSNYPGGIVDTHHLLFPAAIRVNVVRIGQEPSQLLLFNVPVDDVETIYFMVWGYPTHEAPTLRTGEFQRTTKGDYRRVKDGWWDIWERDQDDAAQENQGSGAIADRAVENLGTSDRGIVLFRRMLMEAIEAVSDNRDPLGVMRDENHAIIEFDARKTGIDYKDGEIRASDDASLLDIKPPFDFGEDRAPAVAAPSASHSPG